MGNALKRNKQGGDSLPQVEPASLMRVLDILPKRGKKD